MKKIFLSIIGFSILCRLNTYSQTQPDSVNKKPAYTLNNTPKQDSTYFNQKKLKLDEINFVSSYYSQTGNHSAVTGVYYGDVDHPISGQIDPGVS